MSSDFLNIKKSGAACVGCGRGSSQVLLMRLRTYSRSLCCGACFVNPRYANCANKNPAGTPCNHPPTDHKGKIGPCQMAGCGCERWIHGLEGENDRQLAACVGLEPKYKECGGFGINTGKCGNVILAGPDGTFERLCRECMGRWVRETIDGQREFQKTMQHIAILENLDTDTETPN